MIWIKQLSEIGGSSEKPTAVANRVRSAPEPAGARVTPNPWYWLLAFVATYRVLLVLTFLQQGQPLVSNWVTDAIATAGLLIFVWARLSLGRNIGFVPAQRELVHNGAYAYMRHPVY